MKKKVGELLEVSVVMGQNLGKKPKNESALISMKFGVEHDYRGRRITPLKLIQKSDPNWS